MKRHEMRASVPPLGVDAMQAFYAYRQQLGLVVEDAATRGGDYEARWAIIQQRMETWGTTAIALVRDLQATLGQERAVVREHNVEQEHLR
jgi:hypothetical protein